MQPSDIVNQVLNLGLPAPIDVQVAGANLAANFALAQRIAGELRGIPGAADIRVKQLMDAPELSLTADRVKVQQLGLTQRDVASNLNISLSSNGSTAPNFWLDPRNGVQYAVNVMTPQYKNATMDALDATPVSVAGLQQPQLFRNLTSVARTTIPAIVSHYNISPVVDVLLGADQRDLGGVADDVDAVLARLQPSLPRGSTIEVRGQAASMRTSFSGLAARDSVRRAARLHPPRRELPELARSADHHRRASRRAGGNRLDVVRDRNDAQRAVADGRDHGDGRRDGEQRAADHLCRGAAPRRTERHRSGERCRIRATASRLHDRARHDHGHAANGARHWARAASSTRRSDAP